MRVPELLAEWNLPVIKELVRLEMSESDRFDFKVSVSSKGDGLGLRTSACSFANSQGGFLIFGVSEDGRGDERIVGIPRSREASRNIQDKLQGIEPSISFVPKNPPIELPDGKELPVIEIPKSLRGPHRDSRQRQFWKRGHAGKVEMTYDEVRMAFTDQAERISRIKLVYLSLIDNWVRLEDIVKHQGGAGPLPFTILDLSHVRLFLGDVQSVGADLVEDMFAILREGDSIVARCSQLLGTQQGTGDIQSMVAYHKTETHFAMQRMRPRIQHVITELQRTFRFEPLAPRGSQGPKIPPIPEHWEQHLR